MKINKKFLIFAIVISLTLFGITLYRCSTTSITYDEAYTYMNYVYKNPFYVFGHIFKEGTLANNHLLNSFGISILNTLFHANYNEIIIRIPNVISYLMYFVFAYLITKDNKYKYSSFSLLAFNYGANEFFGLGRGYGMASAFVLGGLYFFSQYIKNKEDYSLTLSYAFLLLGCYANTAALIAYGAVILVSLYLLIKDKKIFKYSLKQIYFLIPIIAFTLLIVKYHFMISSDGLPLYGGMGTFYTDVLVSMFDVYGLSLNNIVYIVNGLILVLIAILSKNSKKLKSNYLVLSAILFFVLLIITTKVTGNMWITGRSLIPSMPLVIILIIETIEMLDFKHSYILELIIISSIVYVFASNLNLKETRGWQDNYIIKDICYEAYKTKDNSKVKEYRLNETTNFYHNKILIENNYDIYEESVKK